MSNSSTPSSGASNTAPVLNTVSPTDTKVSPVTSTEHNKEAPTQAEIRKMKLKFDGQEQEMTEQEVISLAQQGKSSQKRFQEAAQAKKEAEATIKFLKENPREAMKQLGLDPRKFSEEYLMEVLTEEAMSPEQKAHRDMEKKLRKYEADEKALKEKEQQDEFQKLEARALEELDRTFVDALGKSGLTKTPWTVKRMAQLQMACIKKGYEPNATELAKILREDYIEEQKALFGSYEGDKLIEILGPDIVKKLSKAQVAKLKASPQKYSKPVEKREQSTNPTPSAGDWKAFAKKNRAPK